MSGISPEGLWLAIDGIDTVGKSTQVELVTKGLTAVGVKPVVSVPEFSNSIVGQTIKTILEQKAFYSLTDDNSAPLADTIHLLSDMVYQYETSISPIVTRGGVAVADRGPASFVAYQGLRIEERSSNFEPEAAFSWTETLARHCFITPNLTVLIKIPKAELIRRMTIRGGYSSGEGALAFLSRVDDTIEQIARRVSQEVVILDGCKPMDKIANDIITLCLDRL